MIALASLARRMDPVRQGTAEDFWKVACGVDIGGAWYSTELCATIRANRAWYSTWGHHGDDIYSVSLNDVLRTQPAAIAELEDLSQIPGDHDWRKIGYLRWKAIGLSDLQLLIDSMMDAREQYRLNRLAQDTPKHTGAASWYATTIYHLQMASQKRERYWMNFVFEAGFLIGLVWFALWPLIRSQSVKRRLIHLFLLPTLFLLPAWMGYCSFGHPNVGPTGGVLYPWALWFIKNDQFNFGALIPFDVLPQLFYSISQWPAYSIDDARAALHFIRVPPGPFQTLVAGLVLSTLYLLTHVLAKIARHAKRERPGFEVLPPSPKE